MSLFRRGEPLHVRLAREGGLSLGTTSEPAARRGTRPASTACSGRASGTSSSPSPRRRSRATAPSSSRSGRARGLVVEEGPDALDPLAPRSSRSSRRRTAPRRCAATAVSGRSPRGRSRSASSRASHGDEIEVAIHDGERTLVVDGAAVVRLDPGARAAGARRPGAAGSTATSGRSRSTRSSHPRVEPPHAAATASTRRSRAVPCGHAPARRASRRLFASAKGGA